MITSAEPPTHNLNRLCPFIHDRNPFCFCVDLNSQKISQMAEYCMADYEKCPHYPELLATSAIKD